MKIYNKIQTFKTDDFQKQQLEQLRNNKVNVSKFIRDAINEKLEVRIDKRKKHTFNDLKESLNLN
jgi:post-segregation antitoxin (ccd killing protein)